MSSAHNAAETPICTMRCTLPKRVFERDRDASSRALNVALAARWASRAASRRCSAFTSESTRASMRSRSARSSAPDRFQACGRSRVPGSFGRRRRGARRRGDDQALPTARPARRRSYPPPTDTPQARRARFGRGPSAPRAPRAQARGREARAPVAQPVGLARSLLDLPAQLVAAGRQVDERLSRRGGAGREHGRAGSQFGEHARRGGLGAACGEEPRGHVLRAFEREQLVAVQREHGSIGVAIDVVEKRLVALHAVRVAGAPQLPQIVRTVTAGEQQRTRALGAFRACTCSGSRAPPPTRT